MKAQPNRMRACTRVYLVMMGLTFVTFGVGALGMGGVQVSLLVLALALIKGQMVGDYFMGLKGLTGWWRWVILAWLLIPGALIATAFTLTG